jgi:uncharacterized protein (DUF1800 family)
LKPPARSLVLGALALAGCGSADGHAPEQTAEATPSEQLSKPSRANAIRFLEQATFGPTAGDIAHVGSVGVSNAITEQLALGPSFTYSNVYYSTDQVDVAPNATPTSCNQDKECGTGTAVKPGVVCNGTPSTAGVCVSGCRGAAVTGTTVFSGCANAGVCTSPTSAIGTCNQHVGFDVGPQFFRNAVHGPDQLRQRVAFALSQIWVISQVNPAFNLTTTSNTGTRNTALGVHLNLLAKDAFGNYRDLMGDVTRSGPMGTYLTMVNNLGGPGILPNENYARELLQLFTLGLNLLNPDGSLQMSGLNMLPAYSQDDVENLSHILTGWHYGNTASTCPATGKTNANTDWALPMLPCANNHDALAKSFLGTSFPGTSDPVAELDAALDVIFNHPNLPPFVCKQLIQQLVTSNPSGNYVQRVVSVFINDSSGRVDPVTMLPKVRGNLDSVVRAILEDPEARGPVPAFDNLNHFGHLRSPALFITNLLRWVGATVPDQTKIIDPLTNAVIPPNQALTSGKAGETSNEVSIFNTAAGISNASSSMGQKVGSAPSVFNFYPPDAPLPGYSQWVGPEFAIADSSTAMARANFLNSLLLNAGVGGVQIDWSSVPDEQGAMIQWLSDYMLHGDMSSELKALLDEAVTKIASNTNPAISVYAKPLAIYLVAISPEFQIER